MYNLFIKHKKTFLLLNIITLLFLLCNKTIVSADNISNKPEIISVTTSTNVTSHGTDIHNIIRAKSNSPVNWINKSLMQPDGTYVYGGGHGTTFSEISPGIWEYQWTDAISKYAPSGTYTYKNISVENEGMLQSDNWANIEIPIKNNIDPKKPEIISVTTSTNVTSHGTDIHNIIRAKSNSPVNWINKSFMQPDGTYVYGGGQGAKFSEISPGIWEYQWTDTISKYAPSGTYTYKNISVENEGMLQSDTWSNIELNISNSKSEDIFPDGVIDIKDLSLLALYYNCTSTDITWKPEYDFNNDLIIDIYDLVYIATKFN